MLENLKIGSEYDGLIFLIESSRNPPFIRPHHHIELELNLVVQGSITYVVEGRRLTFGRRCLLWLFPSQEHQMVERTTDARFYVCVFTPRMIADTCRGKFYEGLKRQEPVEDGIRHTLLDGVAFDLVRSTMDALVVDGLDPDLLNREAGFGLSPEFRYRHHDPDWLNAGLRHLLLLCWRQQDGRHGLNRSVALHPAVRQALQLVSDPNTDENFAAVARSCGVSPAYLSRTFRKQVGVTLTHYRNYARLGRFWEEFHRPGSRSLLDAVFAAGFGSYPQFFRVFKQAYGVSPSRQFAPSAGER